MCFYRVYKAKSPQIAGFYWDVIRNKLNDFGVAIVSCLYAQKFIKHHTNGSDQ